MAVAASSGSVRLNPDPDPALLLSKPAGDTRRRGRRHAVSPDAPAVRESPCAAPRGPLPAAAAAAAASTAAAVRRTNESQQCHQSTVQSE
ncbi:hypothetical protein E2C01_047699 [Portunus trituberculatus]|uniref:Uncharacterized protein n=1 Tax=Portunus trituberculatus TaxID=210409 RepID=A0A5B7G873_PORTR|nr:hypothetical protein [Portunus trituberculatus]